MRDLLEESKALLVRRWGEMSGYWGINRTMAEIHALLFVSHEALCTDDVMEQLKTSRGNASMNLRAVVDWGLVQRVHKLGDRKECFQADAEAIAEHRRRLDELSDFLATMGTLFELVLRFGKSGIGKLTRTLSSAAVRSSKGRGAKSSRTRSAAGRGKPSKRR